MTVSEANEAVLLGAITIVPNNQIFNVHLVWGDQQFDLNFSGTQLPTTWLVTLDAVVSVSFLALVALFYRGYGKHWQEPDEITKIIIGSLFSIGGICCASSWLPQPRRAVKRSGFSGPSHSMS